METNHSTQGAISCAREHPNLTLCSFCRLDSVAAPVAVERYSPIKVMGYSCVSAVRNVLGNVYLSSLIKNLWYEQREQLDSSGGGALSQGVGHDGSFFDSINSSSVSLEKSGKYGFLVN